MAHPHWPLFDLVVRTPHLELHYVDDAHASDLATLAAEGVHDPATTPFSIPWTDVPSPELERASHRYWWRCRAETRPEHWDINLAVLVAGRVVGVTGLTAVAFPACRTFETGSWLGRAHQGRGVGTEMRAATLHLGFAGLDARFAHTAAWHDNAPSLGVTRRLGYEPNGEMIKPRRHVADRMLAFRLTRDTWERTRRDDVELSGIEGCLDLLGLATTDA